jgi:hypothetical protein
MLDTIAPQATIFPEDSDYFRGVLRVLRTGGLGTMRELRVTFCFNEPGTLPNYMVANTRGVRAHCFGSTHSSFPDPDPEAPEEKFLPETLDTVSYGMTELQQMLAERLEQSTSYRPVARDPMQDVQAMLYA